MQRDWVHGGQRRPPWCTGHGNARDTGTEKRPLEATATCPPPPANALALSFWPPDHGKARVSWSRQVRCFPWQPQPGRPVPVAGTSSSSQADPRKQVPRTRGLSSFFALPAWGCRDTICFCICHPRRGLMSAPCSFKQARVHWTWRGTGVSPPVTLTAASPSAPACGWRVRRCKHLRMKQTPYS